MWYLLYFSDYSAADHFLELPPKRQFPDYYETIEHPTSINIIRRKLKKGEYTGPSAFQEFEYEVRRLFSNAETYNEKGSGIVDDAERLKVWIIVSLLSFFCNYTITDDIGCRLSLMLVSMRSESL